MLPQENHEFQLEQGFLQDVYSNSSDIAPSLATRKSSESSVSSAFGDLDHDPFGNLPSGRAPSEINTETPFADAWLDGWVIRRDAQHEAYKQKFLKYAGTPKAGRAQAWLDGWLERRNKQLKSLEDDRFARETRLRRQAESTGDAFFQGNTAPSNSNSGHEPPSSSCTISNVVTASSASNDEATSAPGEGVEETKDEPAQEPRGLDATLNEQSRYRTPAQPAQTPTS